MMRLLFIFLIFFLTSCSNLEDTNVNNVYIKNYFRPVWAVFFNLDRELDQKSSRRCRRLANDIAWELWPQYSDWGLYGLFLYIGCLFDLWCLAPAPRLYYSGRDHAWKLGDLPLISCTISWRYIVWGCSYFWTCLCDYSFCLFAVFEPNRSWKRITNSLL